MSVAKIQNIARHRTFDPWVELFPFNKQFEPLLAEFGLSMAELETLNREP